MSEISYIIKNYLGKNARTLKFDGEVYFENENQLYNYFQRTNIDRNIFNRILNETNAAYEKDDDLIDADTKILLLFIQDDFVDESGFWEEKKMNYYNSLIFLEDGIINSRTQHNLSKKTNSYFQHFVIWDEIDLIELLSSDGEDFFFRFYYKDKTLHEDINAKDFCLIDLESCKVFYGLLNEILEYRKQIELDSHNEHAGLKSRIEDQLKSQNYEAAIENLEIFKEKYDIVDYDEINSPFYYQKKSLALCFLGKYEEALSTIATQINICNNLNQISPNAHKVKGLIQRQSKNFISAINCFAYSEEFFVENTNINESKSLKEEVYIELKDIFLDLSYNQRKLIFIGNDVYATQSTEIIVLKKNDLPPKINFPIGHPHLNSIYTCHPHKQNFYLPIKDYSEELFMDRINEFSYLLQCLGATKLEISSTKSNSSDQRSLSKNEIDANIDYKINSAEFNYKGESTEDTLIDGKLKIAKKQNFKPVKSPFIPPNLIWYHSDLNWQRLVDQRLNGSIVTHSEIISSSQSENISSHELTQIDAELKLLLPKIGVKYNSENQINSSSLKTHEWIVTVEFEDIDNLKSSEGNIQNEFLNSDNSNHKEYALNLEKYKEDVMFMLEDDGVIDDSERKILDRKIKRYSLSEEDAKAIESKLLTSQYSDNELKYIEELKDLLSDGAITNIERKLLDRYALKYAICSETKAKIDSSFIL